MKTSTALVALMLATAVAGTANAATKHHHHAAASTEASSTDWPGNPHMDNRQDQVGAFWRDAFNPYAATATTK